MYASYRELGKTKRFLRRLSSENMGISVRKFKGNKYHLILGSYAQMNNGGMFMPGFGGLPIGTIGNVNVFFNPTFFAYNSFQNTKATRIESQLDLNFNHLTGDIEENVFDKIQKHKLNETNNGYTIFAYKDYLITSDFNFIPNAFRFKKYKD